LAADPRTHWSKENAMTPGLLPYRNALPRVAASVLPVRDRPDLNAIPAFPGYGHHYLQFGCTVTDPRSATLLAGKSAGRTPRMAVAISAACVSSAKCPVSSQLWTPATKFNSRPVAPTL